MLSYIMMSQIIHYRLVVAKVRVRAFDGGTPPKDNVTTVQVTINRNLFCPEWRDGVDSVDILETMAIPSPVAQVTAVDEDTQVNICTFITQDISMFYDVI